ncbi:MAG TPA: metal-sensitive transcriptional regulator [Dehalococcoidia bacterium]|nr:metal-sensitive transcriptional regulator [Dehalococcoidia bacterium]
MAKDNQAVNTPFDDNDSCAVPVDSRTTDALQRLRRIEGQVRGIQRMLEQGRECNEVLMQLMAIRSGVEEVSVQIIDLHIERCLFEGIEIDPVKRLELNRSIRLMTRFHTPSDSPRS